MIAQNDKSKKLKKLGEYLKCDSAMISEALDRQQGAVSPDDKRLCWANFYWKGEP